MAVLRLRDGSLLVHSPVGAGRRAGGGAGVPGPRAAHCLAKL